jgi:CRISPR/Cas system CSM-associated protein Csm3 (group 7 of RAMP superfamily)
MTTRLTLFTVTLVQDSALSVSGLDRETIADQAFTVVDGIPTMVGRGIKGAAVAMAKRFFDPLPRCVSDDIKYGNLRRSAWEFADTTTDSRCSLRAGVGIRQRTGARAKGVLYDREVIPAGTKWPLSIRVDRSFTLNDDEFNEAEGILGYVLGSHWSEGRCWLGGGAARGLGWCHLENLKVYRMDESSYEAWVTSGRSNLPPALSEIPAVVPTRSWSFRTLDVEISFGEYKPDPEEAAWGLDMLALGPHASEGNFQTLGNGDWARPAWAVGNRLPDAKLPDALNTDRALLMENDRPLLPGASVRGPLRHAFSRLMRASGTPVNDPHPLQGNVGDTDPAGAVFGTVAKSSRVLIRDGRVDGDWAAAKLHMHAEDEFSAGSYLKAKRDAVRLLRGKFPVRFVVEGKSAAEVNELTKLIDRQVALGKLGHLPLGGHKTRGGGAGKWEAKEKEWQNIDVAKARSWTQPSEPKSEITNKVSSSEVFPGRRQESEAFVRTECGVLACELTLGEACKLASTLIGHDLIAWWCEPTIDLKLKSPPATYGNSWPATDHSLRVDEVAFFAARAVWRAAKTANGNRYVSIEEVDETTATTGLNAAKRADVRFIPARLHAFKRFTSENTGPGSVLLREWCINDETLGFTIAEENR